MVSPFLRKVKTASGATAVQIAVKQGRRDKVIEHLGSAHTKAELAALMEIGRHRIAPDQLTLDLPSASSAPPAASTDTAGVVAVVESARSALLWEVLHGAYTRLGLGGAVGGDRAFEQMVLARVIEPSSKAQVPRVLGDLGLEPVTVRTLFRSLARAQERGYREAISQALFEHVTSTGGLTLCLYDVTTLYFETEREDDLRRVGYSKERRVDPQVIVGLLVDRRGFPLRIGCWEGNKAETTTIIPIVEAFQAAHGIEELVIVADAGMLSATNLRACQGFCVSGLQVGCESVGVGGGELGQGLVPVGGDLSFDELALGFALGWWQSFLLVAFSGSFVHRCRRSPAFASSGRRLITGEVAAVHR